MFLDKKPFIYIWRPFYRIVVQGVVWSFLARLKVFLFADAETTLRVIEHRLGTLEAQNNEMRQHNAVLMERVSTLVAEQQKQWESMSNLLLCVFQQPNYRVSSTPQLSRGATAAPGGSSPTTAS